MPTHKTALLALLDARLFELNGRVVTVATLASSVLIIVLAIGASRLARRGIARALSDHASGTLGSDHAVGRLAHYAILGIGFAIALQTAGVDLGALLAASAVVGVGIGLGLQDVAQNFVSGLIVLVERSIRQGDVLEVEGRLVRVLQIGIRATRVRSRDDEILIVPNATLVQSTVRSFTLVDSLLRIRTRVGVAYESDMQRVRTVLEAAARAVQGRVAERDPVVLLADFGASSVDWEVSIWTDDPWNQRVGGSALREAIWNALASAQIRIAFPQLDVHVDQELLRTLGSGAERS